jgi:hypothetical protein
MPILFPVTFTVIPLFTLLIISYCFYNCIPLFILRTLIPYLYFFYLTSSFLLLPTRLFCRSLGLYVCCQFAYPSFSRISVSCWDSLVLNELHSTDFERRKLKYVGESCLGATRIKCYSKVDDKSCSWFTLLWIGNTYCRANLDRKYLLQNKFGRKYLLQSKFG